MVCVTMRIRKRRNTPPLQYAMKVAKYFRLVLISEVAIIQHDMAVGCLDDGHISLANINEMNSRHDRVPERSPARDSLTFTPSPDSSVGSQASKTSKGGFPRPVSTSPLDSPFVFALVLLKIGRD